MPKLPTHLLNSSTSQLIVIDVQSKLLAAMPENAAKMLLDNTIKLCTAANRLQIPTLVSEQYPQGLGPTDPSLLSAFHPNTPIFAKTSFAITAAEGFKPKLAQNQGQQLILVGQESHICILQSALNLAAEGYEVFIVEDAVCSRHADHKLNALQRMRQQGITISNTESVLFEWLSDAAHPDFKQLSRLIR